MSDRLGCGVVEIPPSYPSRSAAATYHTPPQRAPNGFYYFRSGRDLRCCLNQLKAQGLRAPLKVARRALFVLALVVVVAGCNPGCAARNQA